MTTDMVEGYALSPQQERLWLLQQGEPELPYRARCLVRVEGPCDFQRCTAALHQIIERHEILRTTFYDVPGMRFPVQVIGDPGAVSWTLDDLTALSAQEQATRVEALWQATCSRSFDFARGPLLHLSAARLTPTQHVLCMSLAALCADRATLTNLVRDLSQAYAACGQGEIGAEPPAQYADFSAWQSALLSATDGATDRAYWQQRLTPELLHVQLPAEQPHAHAGKHGFVPRQLPVPLHADVVARLATLTRQYHTTPAVFLLACWTLLLWRHLTQADMLIGVACAGRNYTPLQGAFGLFSTYVPLHCALAEQEAFSTFLARLHDTVQEADRRQEYFAWEGGNGQEDASAGPAFLPLSFEFAEQPVAYTGADITFVLEQLEACTERFNVKLVCTYQDGDLHAALHYDAQRFHDAAITSLVAQFQTLVASASTHPEAALGQVELLSAAERQRVLVTFNQTHSMETSPQCLHHLLEAQTARTPDRLAVMCEAQTLTYAALNARANQLAHHLRRLGVGPQTCVGICLPRSLEMLVGIFGILKAGGAYVPLDPTYPRERLAFMLADVQAPVLLTQADVLEDMPAYGPAVVSLDSDWDTIARYSAEHVRSAVTSDNLAYVIYTSGSTGQPKGVLVTHRNVVHSTRAREVYYRHPIASFLLLSSLAFDSSVAGLFWTLCQGGTLILPTEGRQSDLGYLLTLITRHHVSHILSLPSLYALLLEREVPVLRQALRTVIVAGEACTRALVARHYTCLPDTALFNEYGPTEGTVWSHVYPCQGQDAGWSVPIGRPIVNMQSYLLNAQLQPVPPGVPGELYIGGAGVTPGYYKRAALTAERFLPHPYGQVPGARLYKTGDMGRYRPDGDIEFLGRLDHQVKIRGFRIELEEITAMLHTHPGIADAVVVARAVQRQQAARREPGGSKTLGLEDTFREKRLIAYIVPRQEPPPSSGDLRRFLRDKLPAYMMPAFFVPLGSLPLAPNGKLDHQALPEVETLRSVLEATYVRPATETERAIARIWQEVLHIEQVGIHDNFFDLGGHSLALVQVHSKLQAMYGDALSLIDMFQYPTISTLATYVSQEADAPAVERHSARRAARRRDALRRRQQLPGERRQGQHGVHHE